MRCGGIRRHSADWIAAAIQLGAACLVIDVADMRVRHSNSSAPRSRLNLNASLHLPIMGRSTEKFGTDCSMNISQAAERSGISAKMIRYYEGIGLLAAAPRRTNGYRDYGEADVSTLQFIRRTRDLGFSMEEIAALLALWRDKRRSSRDVKRLANTHIADLERRMKDMRAVMRTLRALAQDCAGDDRSDCPILEDLARTAKR